MYGGEVRVKWHILAWCDAAQQGEGLPSEFFAQTKRGMAQECLVMS